MLRNLRPARGSPHLDVPGLPDQVQCHRHVLLDNSCHVDLGWWRWRHSDRLSHAAFSATAIAAATSLDRLSACMLTFPLTSLSLREPRGESSSSSRAIRYHRGARSLWDRNTANPMPAVRGKDGPPPADLRDVTADIRNNGAGYDAIIERWRHATTTRRRDTGHHRTHDRHHVPRRRSALEPMQQPKLCRHRHRGGRVQDDASALTAARSRGGHPA